VYTVTDQSGNKMTVTLTKVIDPAQGADQFTTAGNGNRFVGAVFTITGISGTFSDDANNDATLIGSNGQTYTADFDSIAGYTNFNNGEYNVSAAENSVGAVTFQLPLTVKVTKSNGRRTAASAAHPPNGWYQPQPGQLPAAPAPGRSSRPITTTSRCATTRPRGGCSATIPKAAGMPASWRATPTPAARRSPRPASPAAS
jgi:hypothetical protein